MTERRKTDMGCDDYMNVRELTGQFDGIHGTLREIHTQVKSTNSRVGRLESWRDRIIGGMVVLTALVLPILLYIAKDLIHDHILSIGRALWLAMGG